ncbi:Ubiquinol cytochrome-c reductase assembly protein Cbp3 [Exophiala xenobiotica]|nr:Ubiquinol cytochrome-c reductase assembly protein Cbp3 [Exophiala xenobiotica]KAK5368688.1 Serine carboxypeptidase 3 [Exophiala xenobiotica]KAK5401556.1 Serine carboxypeptidase 3 [Exophiala xenobiotica]KAK5425187.1 Serine carboxypeptidase 3 [Exophiala xenobiotica]KAK5472630.1 Serine carboxypeptidase 3 [Exophiala xenobiotica]
MSSFGICSHCLRALRQSIRQEKLLLARSPASGQRYLSSERKETTLQSNTKRPNLYINIPAGTPTNTTNLTAEVPGDPQDQRDAPEPSKSKSAPKPDLPAGPSVSQMQAQIQESLKRGPAAVSPFANRLAQGFSKTAKGTTQTYITYGETEALFKSCAAQADYTIPEDQRMGILTGTGPPKTADGIDLGHPVTDTWWFNTIGLPPTFSTWSQVAFIHMYIITVRLRAVETASEFQNYQRYLIEHFSHAAEDKMVLLHNMTARGVRNKYLKDLFLQWRGILAAHDEGMIQGDAVLAGAIWRNLFRGQEDVDWEKVALVVAYVRRAVTKVGNLDINTIATNLNGPFGIWAQSHQPVQDLVSRQSRQLNAPVTE